jgi:hypothetical protein
MSPISFLLTKAVYCASKFLGKNSITFTFFKSTGKKILNVVHSYMLMRHISSGPFEISVNGMAGRTNITESQHLHYPNSVSPQSWACIFRPNSVDDLNKCKYTFRPART